MVIDSHGHVTAPDSLSNDETVRNILECTPVPPTKRAPDSPVELEDIVSRLLEKRADRRYQSARALLQALQDVERGANRGGFRRLAARLLGGRPRVH